MGVEDARITVARANGSVDAAGAWVWDWEKRRQGDELGRHVDEEVLRQKFYLQGHPPFEITSCKNADNRRFMGPILFSEGSEDRRKQPGNSIEDGGKCS